VVQPRWSPHGQRIAYWAIDRSGHRDLWTIPADGGSPVPVTRDAAIDWDPVWSPDGKYLYFSSNRGGGMNLWRVPVQEESGRVLGPPEPIHTPSGYSGHLSMSADGRRLGYVEQVISSAIYRVSFDPGSETVITEPAPVTPPAAQASRPSLSADGQWLAFNSAGGQEDVYVVSSAGSGVRQITSDAPPDRGPRWSPDGKRIAFFSKRTGDWEIWTAAADGGDPRQITFLAGPNVAWPVWSPGGETLAYTVFGVNSFLLDLRKKWDQQAPGPLPRYSESGASFSAWAWSPDGRRIAGFEQRADGAYAGIVLYSPATGGYEKLTEYGVDPVWLSDSRRLLFHHEGKLHVVDSATRRTKEVPGTGQHEIARRGFALSRDDRQIYFGVTHTEADVWLAKFE
jgi:Tol biopolymer transport system component